MRKLIAQTAQSPLRNLANAQTYSPHPLVHLDFQELYSLVQLRYPVQPMSGPDMDQWLGAKVGMVLEIRLTVDYNLHLPGL
jgi:hypothetical protein